MSTLMQSKSSALPSKPGNSTKLDDDTVLMLANVSVLIMNNETLLRLDDGRSHGALLILWHPKCEMELTLAVTHT